MFYFFQSFTNLKLKPMLSENAPKQKLPEENLVLFYRFEWESSLYKKSNKNSQKVVGT